MFPYSPEFLRELSPHGHPMVLSTNDTHRPDVSVRAGNPIGPTTEDPASSFQAAQLSEHSTFVASNHCVDLYLSGFARITLMKGCVTINGYQLRIGSSETVYFPPWQPACRIVCGDPYSHRKSKAESQQILACFDKVFKEKGLEYGTAPHEQKAQCRRLFNEQSFILIVDAIPVDEQEWLVAAEDHSGYPGLDTDNCSYGPSTGSMAGDRVTQDGLSLNLTKVSCIRRSSFVLGSVMRLRSLHFDCVTIPPSWDTCTESFLKHVHHSMDNNSIINIKPHPGNKLVVCGAKGVGKSTHTRYVLNRALSDRHMKAQRRMKRLPAALLANSSLTASTLALLGSVCYIDCDLGQPEMSTPGLVSLHVINTPILSPPHLNIRTPERCFFLGDVTSKSEPQLILQCIALLYGRYLEIRDECVQKYVSLKKQQQTQELLSSNTYNALLLEEEEDEEDDGGGDGGEYTNRRELINNNTSDILPLIVNTDGYIKSMGAEILSGILSIIQPTHIVHLCTERDHSILSPTLDEHISSTAPEEVCRVVLSPGRVITAPQIAAVELRSLRLVSSFLRSNRELIKFTRTYYHHHHHHASRQFGNGGDGGDGTTATAAEVGSVNDCIFIRSGSIVDSTGILAVHFLKSSAYSIPFSQLVISTMPKIEVPISLTLAAINASLIAFIKLKDSSSNDDDCKWSDLCAPSTMRFRYNTKHLQQHQYPHHPQQHQQQHHHPSTKGRSHHPHLSDEDDDGVVEFELTVSSKCPLAECVGFGFVRFIDIPNSCLFITTPPNDFLHDLVKETTSASRLRVCIVRGNLQLPTSMLYSPSLVCFPYFTSETTGEGATKSKNRQNLKRREHAA